MVVQAFAFSLFEGDSFHACFFSGNDRDDFPTGAGEYQCAVFTEEGQTFFFVERTVVDTAGMIPDDIEIFVGVCSKLLIKFSLFEGQIWFCKW